MHWGKTLRPIPIHLTSDLVEASTAYAFHRAGLASLSHAAAAGQRAHHRSRRPVPRYWHQWRTKSIAFCGRKPCGARSSLHWLWVKALKRFRSRDQNQPTDSVAGRFQPAKCDYGHRRSWNKAPRSIPKGITILAPCPFWDHGAPGVRPNSRHTK